jgi:3-isopropylmalate/(R)-2-methylmalate dehydratase small subunit
MEKFDVLTGIAAPLMQDNINTDAIIPADWLRSVHADHSEGLFGRWRYLEDGAENPDFVLNQPRYRGANVLIGGRNFGCGSSRENAVWALLAYGIRCVIAPSFGDIFLENATKNGLLAIRLPASEIDAIAAEFPPLNGPTDMTVDLITQRFTTPRGRVAPFDVDPRIRDTLMAGLEQVDRTLRHQDAIAEHQAQDRVDRPWAYPTPADDR